MAPWQKVPTIEASPLSLDHYGDSNGVFKPSYKSSPVHLASPPVLYLPSSFILCGFNCLLGQQFSQPHRIHKKYLLFRWQYPILIIVVIHECLFGCIIVFLLFFFHFSFPLELESLGFTILSLGGRAEVAVVEHQLRGVLPSVTVGRSKLIIFGVSEVEGTHSTCLRGRNGSATSWRTRFPDVLTLGYLREFHHAVFHQTVLSQIVFFDSAGKSWFFV